MQCKQQITEVRMQKHVHCINIRLRSHETPTLPTPYDQMHILLSLISFTCTKLNTQVIRCIWVEFLVSLYLFLSLCISPCVRVCVSVFGNFSIHFNETNKFNKEKKKNSCAETKCHNHSQ